MSGNGNGLTNLARQMTATAERSAAWVFRGLIGALSATLVVIGWFAIDKLGMLDKQFDKLENARASTWEAIGKLTASQSAASQVMTRLGTSLEDYIKNQDKLMARFADQEADHEQRIRQLERLPPRMPSR